MAAQRILVLGATGGTGRHVVDQALTRGLDVTALVRSSAPRPPLNPAARVVVGDLVESPDVEAVFAGHDAVISALGRGHSFRSRGLIAKAVPVIVAAMRRHGVRRLVFTSGIGVGETWQDAPPLSRLFAGTFLRGIYADKVAGEAILKASGLDWTIVYPVGLTNGPRTGEVRVGERLTLTGLPRVSRADVAAVLLDQVDDDRFVGKGILVASAS